MSRPKNKDEYRKELAEAFAGVLEEKGLEWKKEWQGTGGSAPQNGITKACYRGCNAFSLSLTSMLMYGKEASNRKQEIDRQHYTIPNQRPKDKHCGKI